MSPRLGSHVRAFGKLPFAAEFVRVGPDTQLGEQFAEWLDQGLGVCHETAGYIERHDSNTANGISFCFPSEEPRTHGFLVGNMLPSEDRFGRRFPFTVVSEVPSAHSLVPPGVAPISAYRFIHESAGACMAQSAEAVIAQLSPVVPTAEFEFEQATAAFRDWLPQPEQLGLLLDDMFATDAPGGPSLQAVTAVRFLSYLVTAAVTRKSAARCVRLPVGDGSGGFAPAFWLETIRRMSGGTFRMPASFWSTASARGVLLVQLGPLAPSCLGRVFGDIPDDAGLVDLSAPMLPSAKALPELPPNVSLGLLDRGATIAEFFASLASIAAV